MMGLEPTSFCMANASDVRTRAAPTRALPLIGRYAAAVAANANAQNAAVPTTSVRTTAASVEVGIETPYAT
jgi:hypothetical protein